MSLSRAFRVFWLGPDRPVEGGTVFVKPVKHKRFDLIRSTDVSGISGTGRVAEGIQFSDGAVVLRWLGERPSTVVWASLEDAMAIHGHDGATEAVFLD